MATTTFWADLLLDNGEIVRCEVPSKYEDEFWESVEATLKRRDWFSVRQWDGANAQYMGHYVERVNMARVVATL